MIRETFSRFSVCLFLEKCLMRFNCSKIFVAIVTVFALAVAPALAQNICIPPDGLVKEKAYAMGEFDKLNKKYNEMDSSIQYVFQSHYVFWAYYQELMTVMMQTNAAGGYTFQQWADASDALNFVQQQLMTTQGAVNYIYLEENRVFFNMMFFAYPLCTYGPTFEEFEAGATICNELCGDLTSIADDLETLVGTIAVTKDAIDNATNKVLLK